MLTVHTTPLHQTLSSKWCVRSRAIMGPSWLRIVFSPTLPCGVIHVQGGEVYVRGNPNMKESTRIGDARSLVWECKISTAKGFQEEKLIFLPTQIYHLGNWQVLRNIYNENQTPSFFETERLSIISYCSVPAGDSYMKESGMLVVSLRSVKFSLEVSWKLTTYPSPKPT